jgi:hypothetical protein
LGNCGRSTRIGFWKNGCITLIHGNNKVVLYYNEKTKDLEVRYFTKINNNVYSNKLTFQLNKFNIDIFKGIINGLIKTSNFTDNNIYTLINHIVEEFTMHGDLQEFTMCGDLHCRTVIYFLKKLLDKPPQENELIWQQRKETASKAQQERKKTLSDSSFKRQQERNARNALEFERRAEEARLARLIREEQNELGRIQYRRELLASLPSATTETQ